MKLSQMTIDRRLTSAFIFFLKNNGYVCTPNKNTQQPFYISHSETLHITHIIEVNAFGHWLIPEELRKAVWDFSLVSHKHSCIETCSKCREQYNIVTHEFICPTCKEPHIPF